MSSAPLTMSSSSSSLLRLRFRLWRCCCISMVVVLMLSHSSDAVYRSSSAITAASAASLRPEQQLTVSDNLRIAMLKTLREVKNYDGQEQTTQRSRGQEVIDAVPMEDRGSFIRYQLAKAILQQQPDEQLWQSHWNAIIPRAMVSLSMRMLTDELSSEFEAIPVYDEFPGDLLHWFKDTFDVNEWDLYRFIMPTNAKMCTEDGNCFSPAKIGCCMCCPF